MSHSASVELRASDADRDGRPRSLLLADLHRAEDWTEVADELTGTDTEGFALLVATADHADLSTIEALARWSIPSGIFSASFWGPGCEVAHDTFDEIDVILDIEAGVDLENQPVVMTTWHAEESLEEALDYFWECPSVDDGKTYGPRRIVLAISPDGQLAERVRIWATRASRTTTRGCPACGGTGLDPRQARYTRPHRYTTGGHDESAPCPTCGGSGEVVPTEERP